FRDGRTLKLAGQLFEAVGSVGANISEGYSRGHQKDRARFYEYSLGSARESRTWYFDGRFVLGEAVAHHRIQLHTQIIRLLLKMVPSTRGYALHEGNASDSVEFVALSDNLRPLPTSELEKVLENVPMPEPELTEYGTRNTEHTTRNPLPALAFASALLMVTPSSALDWPQF